MLIISCRTCCFVSVAMWCLSILDGVRGLLVLSSLLSVFVGVVDNNGVVSIRGG